MPPLPAGTGAERLPLGNRDLSRGFSLFAGLLLIAHPGCD